MVSSVALDEPICPRGGITFKRNERHIGRDAFTDPTTELRGLKVLENFFRGGKSPEIGRRMTASGIVYVVPLDQSALRGSDTEAGQELSVEEIKGLKKRKIE